MSGITLPCVVMGKSETRHAGKFGRVVNPDATDQGGKKYLVIQFSNSKAPACVEVGELHFFKECHPFPKEDSEAGDPVDQAAEEAL